jgi:DnaJ-class molecular chaperone
MAMFKSKCGACDGTGRKKRDSGRGHTKEPCAKCGGTGVIATEETPVK